jgi:uncharacterized protein YndB with AHSA1/START domain
VTPPSPATASVEVPCAPEVAFQLFTAEIGSWWKRGTNYWNDADKGQEYRLEPGVGGRLVEVYDPETGDGYEVGRVLVWEPGRRLVFTWRQADWKPSEFTEVEVRFAAAGAGTRVTVEHGGWDRLSTGGAGLSAGYSHGWDELLHLYAQNAEAR